MGRMFICVLLTLNFSALGQAQNPQRWSSTAANDWYSKRPWLVGSNYVPANAINQLEMWQPDTFDPKRIDTELSWAEGLGMNTMRVFLHDLLWQQDPAGFQKRIDTFLAIADMHKIKPILVLFDSCWDPQPKLGKQRNLRPGVHNSGWVQSPGANALKDPTQYPRLEAYVRGVVGALITRRTTMSPNLPINSRMCRNSCHGFRVDPCRKRGTTADEWPLGGELAVTGKTSSHREAATTNVRRDFIP